MITRSVFEPKNEMGVIVKFSQEMHLFGWDIVSIQSEYPDAILRKDGVEYAAEFEYKSSAFVAHRHDMRNVDIIVCWIDNFRDCPVPVIALSDQAWGDIQPIKVDPVMKEAEYKQNTRQPKRLQPYQPVWLAQLKPCPAS